MIKWLLGAFLLLAPSLALAQTPNKGQIVPSGAFTPGHTVRCENATCTVAVDAGGSGGSSKSGQSYLTEIGITNTGTPFCISDALINAVGGYHQFCLGANALGGGLISYNAIGGASPLSLNFNINGQTFTFPGPGNGNVAGPNSAVVGHPAIFSDVSGKIIADTPTISMPVTQTITSAPSDFSHTPFNLSQTISGATTLGTPATGFTITPQAVISNEVFTNNSGWMQSGTTFGDGSTGAFAHNITINTSSTTFGATGAMFVTGTCMGNKAGANDYLANSSCQTLTGQINAAQNGVYLQGLGDLDIFDQGFNAAGVGAVLIANRTVANAAGLGLSWEIYDALSTGSVPVDALFHGVGKARVGLDLTAMSSNAGVAGLGVGIALPQGTAIFGDSTLNTVGAVGADCTTGAVNADRAVCVVPGGEYIVGSGSTNGWGFGVGGTGVLQMTSTAIVFAVVPSLPGSTTGSSTPTYTNSPCVNNIKRWVPVQLGGQAGAWYIPACN